MYGALDDEKKMEVRLIERDGRPVDQGDSRRGWEELVLKS